jgi:hypothetical protein
VINRRTVAQPPVNGRPSQPIVHTGVYITYSRKEDAAKAIDAVDGSSCEGRVIRYLDLIQCRLWNHKVLLILPQKPKLPERWMSVPAREWRRSGSVR